MQAVNEQPLDILDIRFYFLLTMLNNGLGALWEDFQNRLERR